ncbi:unnamed protein product [Caenorhabditis auriculariae]|uniref:Uncharacterized protein n=1 Tax=Caenorhabditis auriculariae TaxID=2777116 RepID=A0A8S1HUN4_9PELO|nr:unnamed protein product [Caenorhabditis auriculariae]
MISHFLPLLLLSVVVINGTENYYYYEDGITNVSGKEVTSFCFRYVRKKTGAICTGFQTKCQSNGTALTDKIFLIRRKYCTSDDALYHFAIIDFTRRSDEYFKKPATEQI